MGNAQKLPGYDGGRHLAVARPRLPARAALAAALDVALKAADGPRLRPAANSAIGVPAEAPGLCTKRPPPPRPAPACACTPAGSSSGGHDKR